MDYLTEHLKALSQHYPLWIGHGNRFVVIGGVLLPPGFNLAWTEFLLGLPSDYPMSPLGVATSRLFVSPTLRFHRRQIKDLHPGTRPEWQTPGFGPWAWWCYEAVNWDPRRDNIITFMEMVRADMTNPRTI